jgi:hypothetical protein
MDAFVKVRVSEGQHLSHGEHARYSSRAISVDEEQIPTGAARSVIGLAKHFFGCPEQEEARAS